MGKLIIDGNSVYELDENCIREKEQKKEKEAEKEIQKNKQDNK